MSIMDVNSSYCTKKKKINQFEHNLTNCKIDFNRHFKAGERGYRHQYTNFLCDLLVVFINIANVYSDLLLLCEI